MHIDRTRGHQVDAFFDSAGAASLLTHSGHVQGREISLESSRHPVGIRADIQVRCKVDQPAVRPGDRPLGIATPPVSRSVHGTGVVVVGYPPNRVRGQIVAGDGYLIGVRTYTNSKVVQADIVLFNRNRAELSEWAADGDPRDVIVDIVLCNRNIDRVLDDDSRLGVGNLVASVVYVG